MMREFLESGGVKTRGWGPAQVVETAFDSVGVDTEADLAEARQRAERCRKGKPLPSDDCSALPPS